MNQQELQFILRMRDEATRILRQHGVGLKKAGKDAKGLADDGKKAASAMDTLAKAAKAAGAAMAGAFASTRLLRSTLGAFAYYERGMIMVQKTTNMTSREMESFQAQFDSMMMSMNGVSVDSMLEIAAAAGQLGISGGKEIQDFSRIMAELALATDVVGEQGAKSIARLLTITKEGIEAADQFTNVLVYLGNTTAATEREILRVASRVGQATAQFKLGSTAILGLSAAAAQLDFRPELFGTSMGRLFQELNDAAINATEGMHRLSEMTGMSRDQFLEMLKTKPENAMLVFLQVLKEMRDDGQSLSTFLESFNLQAVEMQSILGASSQNLDLFRQKLAQSSREQEQGSARSKEFAQAVQALWAQWEGLKASLTLFGKTIGSTLAPIAEVGIAGFRMLVNGANAALSALPGPIQSIIALVVTLAPAVAGAVAAFSILSKALKAVGVTSAMGAILGWAKSLIGLAVRAVTALMGFARLGAVFAAVRAAVLAVSTAMAGLLGWPVLISGAMIAAAAAIIANWDKVTAFFSQSWSDIGQQIWDAVTGAFGRALNWLYEKWTQFVSWMGSAVGDEYKALEDTARKAKEEAERLSKVGGFGIIGELKNTNIGKGLSGKSADLLREFYYPKADRREIEAQKKALEELLSLSPEARINAGYLPQDIEKLKALIRKAEQELDPISVEVKSLDREIEAARALTKAKENELAIRERIREIEEEHGKLTDEQNRAIQDRMRALHEIEKTTAYEEMVRELRRGLEQARALTEERKVELEIANRLADAEREIGTLTAQRRAEIARLIAQTKQLELFKDLEGRLDPIRSAIRSYEQDVRTLGRAFQSGAIDAQRYLQLLEQLNQSTLAGRNPVADRVRELREELHLQGLIGREREIEQTVLQEINALREKGVMITSKLAAAVREYATAMADVNAESRSGINAWMDSLGTFEDGLRRLEQDAIGGLSDALADLFTGTGNSMQQWAANLGKQMVRLAINHMLKDLLSGMFPDRRQAALDRASQALNKVEQLGVKGINTPQAIINAGSVAINGTPLGGAIPGLPSLAANDNVMGAAAAAATQSVVEQAITAPVQSALQDVSTQASKISVDAVASAAKAWSDSQALTVSAVEQGAKSWSNQFEQSVTAATENLTSSTAQSFNEAVSEFQSNVEKLGGLNLDGRMREATEGLIMHHTAGRGDPSDVADVLNKRGFGAHYIMDRDGNIFQMAPDNARLSHMRPGQGVGAGLSNSNTIGMEVIARNNQDLTPAQIAAGKQWIEEMRAKYPGIGTNVFGHGEVNPHKQGDEGTGIVEPWRQDQSMGLDAATQKLNELGQAGQSASQALNQAKMATDQAAQAEKMSSQQTIMSTQQEKAAKDQLSFASQNNAWQTQNAGNQIQQAGTQAGAAAPQFQQAGTSIQQAGQQASMAGQQASMATPGMGGLGAGISGLLGPLNQAIPGMGQFTNMIMQLLQSLMGGMGNGMGGMGGMLGMLFHTGGVVGKVRNPTRRVPATAFAGAPRFHEGLFRRDEFPAILQRGERVLTANDNRRVENVLRTIAESDRSREGSRGGNTPTVIMNVNGVQDASSFQRSQSQILTRLQGAMTRARARNG
ncbi:MAG: phage tail tape measure protein [Burkholderiaceae bacterium]|nr:phage tail tape measure protein [Burkholderiaceae bacterium]